MLKFILPFATFFCCVISSCSDNDHDDHTNDAVVISRTEPGKSDTIKKSVRAVVQNDIGGGRLIINYNSPAVRDRVIWGKLVPYDKVWVTGAHNATTITSNKNFIIGGQTIPAGKYAFFTIPGKDEWTVIINKNWDQHLADKYKQENDVVRTQVKPDTLDYTQERLMYEIIQRSEKEGNILMSWEKLRITIPVLIAD